jgi:hypothetical protein
VVRHSEKVQSVVPHPYHPPQHAPPSPADMASSTLDMTVLPSFNNDDSFYLHKSINSDRLDLKLSQLRTKLLRELDNENLPYTKQILSEMIQNLNQLIALEDTQLAKTIAFKIEQGINKLRSSNEGSLNLYHYMNKAIKHA